MSPWWLDPACRGVGRPVAVSGYAHSRAVLVGQAGCLSHHVSSKYVTEFMIKEYFGTNSRGVSSSCVAACK